MAANSVINGGKLMKPYIVSEIQTPDGETLEHFHPTVMAAPIRPETSDTMRLLPEREIMQEMLPYLGIEPENDEKDEEIEVPALKGLTIGDAKRKLSQVGLESVTDGANTVVLDQLPPAGAKLVKGGHVMLYTAGFEVT